MSILNQACTADCEDKENCPGIHPYTGGDGPLYAFIILIAGGLGLLAFLGERGWLT